MITLEEAVIGIPIGKAAGIGIPFIAEDVDVLLVHFDRRCETSNGKRFFFFNYNVSWTTQRKMDVRGRCQSALLDHAANWMRQAKVRIHWYTDIRYLTLEKTSLRLVYLYPAALVRL